MGDEVELEMLKGHSTFIVQLIKLKHILEETQIYFLNLNLQIFSELLKNDKNSVLIHFSSTAVKKWRLWFTWQQIWTAFFTPIMLTWMADASSPAKGRITLCTARLPTIHYCC